MKGKPASARIGHGLYTLHGVLLAVLLAESIAVGAALRWLGRPVIWIALCVVMTGLVLWVRRLTPRRDPLRVGLFGSPDFLVDARRRAEQSGRHVVLTAVCESQPGVSLLRFLVDLRRLRAGTIVLQLPKEATVLRRRVPRLVESEPARVLLTDPPAGHPGGTGDSWLGQPVALVAMAPLRLPQHLVKRALDLIIALPALLFLLPLFIVIAIAIRLESPGSALFRQLRIGRLGQTFMMFKFRSMRSETLADGAATARDDPRVTRLGRWLRATSIDELPQLINVALGEMSIVGPRPHMPAHRVEDGIFTEIVAEYASRHRVTPGITGLAQISGMRGGIESYERARRNVLLDLRYIHQWSLWLDLCIIMRTLMGGMSGRDVF